MSHTRHEIEALFAELYERIPEWSPQQFHAVYTPRDASYRDLEELIYVNRHVKKWDEFTPFGRSLIADMRHELDKLYEVACGPKLTFLAWSMERLHQDISTERLIELANGPRHRMPSGVTREQRREWARGIKNVV